MKTMRIATLAGLAMIAAGSVFAADVTINISGNVQATTCVINNKKVEDNMTVSLRTVSANLLDTAGKVEEYAQANVNITGCDASFTKVEATFLPLNVNTLGRLNNTARADSKVDIEVMKSPTEPLNLVTSSKVEYDVSGGAVTIPLGFRYHATGVATAGPVASQLQIGLAYK